MNIELVLAIGRVLERLVVCLFAGLSIIAGYRLFMAGVVAPQSADLSSKSFSLKLQKCGPGIFFGLFGTVILSMCLEDALVLKSYSSNEGKNTAGTNQPSAQSVEYIQAILAGENTGVTLLDVSKSITTLANLDGNTNDQGAVTFRPEQAIRLSHAIPILKAFQYTLVTNKFTRDDIDFYRTNHQIINDNPGSLDPDRLEKLKKIQKWLGTPLQ